MTRAPLFADADLIHCYTRARALADGVLRDVTATAAWAVEIVPLAEDEHDPYWPAPWVR